MGYEQIAADAIREEAEKPPEQPDAAAMLHDTILRLGGVMGQLKDVERQLRRRCDEQI